MWHPILLVFNNEERSSIYTANNDGDNIPPYRTPLEIVKYGDISAPHLIGEGVYVKVNVLGKLWTNRYKKITETISKIFSVRDKIIVNSDT